MEGCVYILQNRQTSRYYVGSTRNLERRLRQHKSGSTKTTKSGDWELVFSQTTETINQAREAEKKIKSWKRRDFIDRIVHEGRVTFLDK